MELKGLKELLSNSEDRDYLEGLPGLQLKFDQNIDQIDNDYILNLAAILSTCINLEELNLEYGFIGLQKEVNYNPLFEVWQTLPKLKKLILDFNCIGNLKDQDVQAFADFIAKSNLNYLSLIDNNLGDLDYNNLEKIFIALPKCRNLQYLYILYNNSLDYKDDATFDMMHQSFINCSNLINLEKFSAYSKEREDKISKIKSIIISRVTLDEKPIFFKYFSSVLNTSSNSNNINDSKELNSNLQETYLLEDNHSEENNWGKNLLSKFKSLNCTIM